MLIEASAREIAEEVDQVALIEKVDDLKAASIFDAVGFANRPVVDREVGEDTGGAGGAGPGLPGCRRCGA